MELISKLSNLDLIIYLLVLICYYFLAKSTSKRNKYILLFLFIILSFFLNFNIVNYKIRDFDTYVKVINLRGHNPIGFLDFFYEPYFLLLSKYLIKFISVSGIIEFYYFILILVSLLFFSWLSFLEEISLWKKYFLFNLFYLLFTFVLLRNGIAYMLIAVFFYYLSKGRFYYSFFSSILFHLTVFPILLFSFFRHKKINLYIIPFCLSLILLFVFLFFDTNSVLYSKYQDFKINSLGYNNTIHYLVFVSSITIFIFYYILYKNQLNNYFYVSLLFIYLILFYFNSVMGFRFSFYILLYLMLNTKLLFSSRLENILNSYSILFIVFGFLTFKLFLYI
jgi:hypothetical protein